jgi:threonine dehydrogenase-like Zn-dependent dehydrogenase
MKALVYTAPRQLEIRELPVPEVNSNELLVRVRAAGVCGSDLDGFLGKSKKRVPPLVLGHEFSGEVIIPQNCTTELRAGDRVAVFPLMSCGKCRYCRSGLHHICPTRRVYGLDFHGGLAEYVAAPLACLFKLPESMSFAEGALVEPLANAIHVLGRLPSIQDRSGVVYGAGPIGALVCWTAKYLGAARVAVVDMNPNRLAKMKDLGADLLFHARSDRDVVNDALEWTGGKGTDFAVDAVGHGACRRNILAMMAPGSAAVWVGLGEDSCELNGRAIVTRELEIRGSYAYGFKDFAQALEILARHVFPVPHFVSERPLESGQQVFEELAGGQSGLMKVVFQI